MVIYQPKKYSLILIQSKYIINNNTLKHDRTYYKNTAKKFPKYLKKELKKKLFFLLSNFDSNSHRSPIKKTTAINNNDFLFNSPKVIYIFIILYYLKIIIKKNILFYKIY
jgi:hypothetical protein